MPPNPKARLSPTVRAELERIVGADRLSEDEATLSVYGRDTCDMFAPAPGAVVWPEDTRAVHEIVVLANQHDLAIVPSGGRTGLSGGATATEGELVVSLERINRITARSVIDRTVRCQGGVVTAKLQEEARGMGLYYPVDFAASGSSHVGGNIATNAGGNRVIRYGMTRNWVAALQLVTGSGEILELGRGLHKDNTGYALHHNLIGSEGTLGIITEATMRLAPAPGESAVMVLGLEDLEALLPTLAAFQARTTLNAFEFFTEPALARVIERHGLQRPFEPATPIYALIEFEAQSEARMQTAIEVFEHCVEQSWVKTGIVSQSREQAASLWRLRDDISETLSHWSPYKNDLSVRVSLVPEFLAEVGRIVNDRYPGFEVLWYGHIGDGNVHLNILKPKDMAIDAFREQCGSASEEIFGLVEHHKGSVSAEHGVGLLKKPYLRFSRSPGEMVLMRSIKRAFDPNGIMNPGKIFE